MESLVEWAIPALLLLAYILFTSQSKAKAPPPPPRQPLPKENNASSHVVMPSQVEERSFHTSIAERTLSTTITPSDQAAPAITKKTSRARRLVKNKSSLRRAFLLQTLLNRPYR